MLKWQSLSACWAALIFMTVEPVESQNVPLVADLSDHLIAITTGFTGTDVLLFGATDGPGDIAIIVKGPIVNEVVRKKDRIGPVWVNSEAVAFGKVPSFYLVASNRPLETFAPKQLRTRYQMGADYISYTVEDVKKGTADVGLFQEALVRLKTRQGFYDRAPVAVNLMANRLFRTQLHFPANVPTGTYTVEIYLIRDEIVVSAEIVPLTISKIGLGAEIYDFAHNHAPLYGLLAIVIAVVTGWVGGVAFRRS